MGQNYLTIPPFLTTISETTFPLQLIPSWLIDGAAPAQVSKTIFISSKMVQGYYFIVSAHYLDTSLSIFVSFFNLLKKTSHFPPTWLEIPYVLNEV